MKCDFARAAPKNGRPVVQCTRPGCGRRMWGSDPGNCFAECLSPSIDDGPPPMVAPLILPVHGEMLARLELLRAVAEEQPGVAGASGRFDDLHSRDARLSFAAVESSLAQLAAYEAATLFGASCRVKCRASIRYAPGAAMERHNNADASGLRMYLTHNAAAGSKFLYASGEGPMTTLVEPAGWHAKYFWITACEPYYWHAIEAQAERLSFGFLVDPNVTLAEWRSLVAECRFGCRHLGEPTSRQVLVDCLCPAGKSTIARYREFACAEFGVCLPGFRCIEANKEAIGESWRYDAGDEVEAIGLCRDCEQYKPQTQE